MACHLNKATIKLVMQAVKFLVQLVIIQLLVFTKNNYFAQDGCVFPADQ